MTDDKMDARLRAAGEAWRNANAGTVVVDSETETLDLGRPRPSHRTRWLTIASAAVVAAALVLGSALLLRTSPKQDNGLASPERTAALAGQWTITEQPDATLTFRPGAVRISIPGCETTNVDVSLTADTMTFAQRRAPGAACINTAEEQGLLTGTVDYSVSGDRLSIAKTGAGSVQLDRAIAAIVGPKWYLTNMDLDVGSSPAVAGHPNLQITDGHLVGSDGCNTMSGDVQVDIDSADLSQLAITEMACTDSDVSATALGVDTILSGKVSYQVYDGNKLAITKEGVGTLVYVTTDPTSTLVGRTWVVQTIKFGDDVYATLTAPNYPSRLVFTDSTVSATHRCFSTEHDVTIDSATAMFRGGTSNEHSCPALPDAAARANEAQGDQAIEAMISVQADWSVRGDTLTLRDPDGVLVLHDSTPVDSPDLTGKAWTLTGTETVTTKGGQSSGSGSSAISKSVVTFNDDGTFTVEHHCYTNQGKAAYASGTTDLSDLQLKSALPCPSNAETTAGQKENDFVDTLLKGHVAWSIDNGELSITNGDSSATFDSLDGTGLLGTPWTAQSLQRGVGPDASVSSTPAVDLIFTVDGVSDSGGDSANVKIAGSTINFKDGWTNNLVLNGGAQFDSTDSNFVYDRLLVGAVHWSIDGNKLMLTKPGVGALTLTNG